MIKRLITIGLLLGMVLVALPFLPANAEQKATVFHPFTGERKVVEINDPKAFDGGFFLETPTNNFDLMEGEVITVPCTVELCGEDANLGFSVITRYRTRLTSSITSTQSTVPVATTLTFDNEQIEIANLGGKVFLSLEPGTNREEIVKCEGRSSNTWTSCTRGLAFSGTSESSVPANRQAHNAGSIVVMSNVHYVYEQLTDTDTAQTVTAPWTINSIWSFGYHPILTSGESATNTNQFITLGQAQALVNQGAATSTESVGGIVRLGTLSDIANSVWYGINDPTVVQTRYTTTTPSANITTGFVPAVGASGKLHQTFFDLTETWNFTSLLATSATTTRLVVGSTNPTTNDALWVGGNAYISGNSTTTGSSNFNEICFGGTNCQSGLTTDLKQVFLPFDVATATSSAQSIGTNNLVRTYPVKLDVPIRVSKVMFEITSGGSAGREAAVALYTMDGSTKLIDSGAISVTTNAVYTSTLGSSVYLPAGNYLLAWTADNSSIVFRQFSTNTTARNFINAVTVRLGTAANASTEGAMPSTLGTITGADSNPPAVMLSTE